MKILAILASPNSPSNSSKLAEHFLSGVKAAHPDCDTSSVTLSEYPLEQFSLKHYDAATEQEPAMNKLEAMITEADGVLIATPVWNFGVPAQLKNLVDRMGSFGLDAETRSKGTLNGKPFYYIFTGGAPVPAWAGLMKKTTSFLPQGIQYFGGSSVGTLFEGKCTVGRGKFGLVVHERPETLTKAESAGKEFAAIVQTYLETGQPPLKQAFMSKVMKLGETIMKKVF